MKFLEGKDYQIDLSELSELLKKEDIKHELRPHPVFEAEKGVKDLIGYSPSGEWQIIISAEKGELSIIRGMVSFGDYEVFGIKGFEMKDPERTETAEEMVELVKKFLLKNLEKRGKKKNRIKKI